MPLFKRSATLDGPAREVLTRVVSAPQFELIPLRNVEAQSLFLPAGATVTVTASPAKPIEATVELSVRLVERGFRVVPHLSARMIRDRAHLTELVTRLESSGIERSSFSAVTGGAPTLATGNWERSPVQ